MRNLKVLDRVRLLCSLAGLVAVSTVIKEIVLDLLEKTDDRVGLITLEESVGDTAEKFISMALNRSLSDPPPATEQEQREGFEKVFGNEKLILLDHQGSVGDSSLTLPNTLEFVIQTS